MSYCRQDGKDRVIFVTKEDHDTPSKITLSVSPDDEPRGLILPNGEINWSCPCLGGMATGPCGVEFREAFSCFHYSIAEPKGSDCLERFEEMQKCMAQYPTLYPKKDNVDDEEGDLDDLEEISSNLTETKSDSTSIPKEVKNN